MALKDRFDRLISYFDTDDMSEVEDDREIVRPQEPARSQAVERPVPPRPKPEMKQPAQQPQRPTEPQAYRQPVQQPVPPSRPSVQSPQTRREEVGHQMATASTNPQMVIDIKYPKRYEDAQEIVDLLIDNECVLIDFQYMMDAQARRCIDFIDGASRVLFGNLKKVGNTMFLLTPRNVEVRMEEMLVPNHGQDISYDYDMKRR